jgi:hypothetical protein
LLLLISPSYTHNAYIGQTNSKWIISLAQSPKNCTELMFGLTESFTSHILLYDRNILPKCRIQLFESFVQLEQKIFNQFHFHDRQFISLISNQNACLMDDSHTFSSMN